MSKFLHRFADFCGYQLKRKTKLYNSQNTIKSLLSKHKIDLIIDVGANIGQFAQEMRSIGYLGEIISFEPVNATYEQLLVNSKDDPLWKVINLGLGAKEEEISINTSVLSDFNSILTPNDFAVKTWERLDKQVTEQIRIIRLDEFIFSHGLQSRRIFLKLDTQGFDLEAFKGSVNCLEGVKMMQSELSFIPIYEGMPGFQESIEVYAAHDFMVSAFFPISTRSDGAAIEMDCLFVRKSS